MRSLKNIKVWILFLVAAVLTVTISVHYPILTRMAQKHMYGHAQNPLSSPQDPKRLAVKDVKETLQSQRRGQMSKKQSELKDKLQRADESFPVLRSKNHPNGVKFSKIKGESNGVLKPTKQHNEKRPKTDLQKRNEYSRNFLHTSKPTPLKNREILLDGDGRKRWKKMSNSNAEIDDLTQILRHRLKRVTGRGDKLLPSCDSDKTIANSCDGKCLRTKRPKDIRSRIAQLVEPTRMHIKKDSLEIIREMSQKVKGHYDVIIITAASSNHYMESQALIKNLHENVFPWLKNFTFLFYDIGLKKEERRAVVKYCRCQVLDYPFEKFPQWQRYPTCYTWKPTIVKAHYHQTNLLFWADSSVRLPQEPVYFKSLMKQARERGLQVSGAYHVIGPFFTNRTMYHFFGDEPCMYLGMTEGQPGMAIWARDSFVERVILEPWVACAMDVNCMCLTPGKGPTKKGCEKTKILSRDFKRGNATIEYGLCHLFDQSAISLIIHKLYQEHYRYILPHFDQFKMQVKRGDRFSYFPQQEIKDVWTH